MATVEPYEEMPWKNGIYTSSALPLALYLVKGNAVQIVRMCSYEKLDYYRAWPKKEGTLDLLILKLSRPQADSKTPTLNGTLQTLRLHFTEWSKLARAKFISLASWVLKSCNGSLISNQRPS